MAPAVVGFAVFVGLWMVTGTALVGAWLLWPRLPR
jgi:hypothetical protein